MREVDNMSEFLGWAETAIRDSKIQLPIAAGIVRRYHDIFREVEERGSFSVGLNAGAWATHITNLLESARQEGGRIEVASASVSYFVGDVYATTIAANGTSTLEHLVAAICRALKLSADDLLLRERGRLLRSSPAFDERFFRRIRLPILPKYRDKRAARLRWESAAPYTRFRKVRT